MPSIQPQFQRPLQIRDSLLSLFDLCVYYTEVEVRSTVTGIDLNRLTQIDQSLVVLTCLYVGDPAVEVGLGILRVEGDGLVEVGDGAVEVTQLGVGVPTAGVGELRIEGDGLVEVVSVAVGETALIAFFWSDPLVST